MKNNLSIYVGTKEVVFDCRTFTLLKRIAVAYFLITKGYFNIVPKCINGVSTQ